MDLTAPPGSYQERIALAAREPAAFWGPLARDALVWDTPYHTVSDCDFRSGRISWFLGGQLNVSVNCLDQHVQKSPESIALIWERDEPGTEVKITYSAGWCQFPGASCPPGRGHGES
ncbi:hypothetical protein Celaphus_00007610 [Cervus elaphus hippelaphus]|uniref:Acetyl-coenzyme A synthetase N-terminal domain-containing protein n=1 Tax=Cervus elaphus hippelaphus TaxID=46360 RepID=A0A212CB51_CEREH|nr:hypothetical protein Celaphus_00007610 [Cervus elaphus hippelaphus]